MRRGTLVVLLLLSCSTTYLRPAHASGTISLVSHVFGDEHVGGSGSVLGPFLSKTGRYVAFSSDTPAGEYISGATDANADFDVFLLDRQTGVVRLVSHVAGTTGVAADGSTIVEGMTPSGRFLLLSSAATNLVGTFGNNNGSATDSFVYDTKKDRAMLVSHVPGSATSGGTGGSSFGGVITEKRIDRKMYPIVAFESQATDLIAGFVDQNATLRDLFRFHGKTRKVNLITHDAVDPQQGSECSAPATCPLHGGLSISANGRKVAYSSDAQNLVPTFQDNNGTDFLGDDIYLYDASTKSNVLVSHAAGFAVNGGNAGSDQPALSANGRWLAYVSSAGDLIDFGDPYDNNGAGNAGGRDVFLYDTKNKTTQLISRRHDDATEGLSGTSAFIRPSADGRYLTFHSESSTELLSGMTDGNGGVRDVFQLDRQTGLVALVSRIPSGATTSGNAESRFGVPTPDGRFVVFDSFATNLLGVALTDTNGGAIADRYIWDRQTGAVEIVSHAHNSETAGSAASVFDRIVSADGAVKLFTTDADNHVNPFADNNGGNDLYVSD